MTIESVEEQGDSHHIHIIENVIRPAGGGQAGERGRLRLGDEEVVVKDTIGDIGSVVLVTDGVFPEGAKVELEIDMDWRRSMMMNHSAEHVFVSILKRQHGGVEVGDLWIDGKHGSVELLGESLDLDSIFEAERKVGNIIEQDLQIESDFVESSSLDSSVRSREGLSEKHEHLRVVRVGDLDSSACSGIHVSRTGEIGFFKVIDVKLSRGSTRIEFVTGVTAASIVSSLYNAALRRKYSYPFEMEQLGAVLDRAKSAVEDKENLIEKITELLVSGSEEESIGGIAFKNEFLPGFDANSLRLLVNRMTTKTPSVIVLFAPGKKSQLVVRVCSVEHDVSEYISNPMKDLGGKGGGKGEVFTGGFTDVEDPVRLYEDLITKVREVVETLHP